MDIYLVRHSHTSAPSGICYGRADVGVDSTFSAASAQVRQILSGVDYGRVYSSPLRRCRLMAKQLAHTVVIDARLTELAFGRWELTSWESVYERKDGQEWFADYTHVAPPDGESYPMMRARVEDFVRYLIDYLETDPRPVVIVTHSGVIRLFLRTLLGYTFDQSFDRQIAYAEVIHLHRSSDGGWREIALDE